MANAVQFLTGCLHKTHFNILPFTPTCNERLFLNLKPIFCRSFLCCMKATCLLQSIILDLTTLVQNYEYRKFFLCNYFLAGLLPALCTNILISLKVCRVLSAKDLGLTSIQKVSQIHLNQQAVSDVVSSPQHTCCINQTRLSNCSPQLP